MTPQQLKAIAEAQGYTVSEDFSGIGKVFTDNLLHPVDYQNRKIRYEYNPINNRAQLDELLEWLGLRGWCIYYNSSSRKWHVINRDTALRVEHKDRTTAILIAACKEVGC